MDCYSFHVLYAAVTARITGPDAQAWVFSSRLKAKSFWDSTATSLCNEVSGPEESHPVCRILSPAGTKIACNGMGWWDGGRTGLSLDEEGKGW